MNVILILYLCWLLCQRLAFISGVSSQVRNLINSVPNIQDAYDVIVAELLYVYVVYCKSIL